MRAFGSNRSKGTRKHAGVDLYQREGTPIRAMEDGVVVRPSYPFYLGTNALEVYFPSMDKVVRYGEISNRRQYSVKLKPGEKVKAGQVIGHVGRLKKINMEMLHLEMYEGAAKGQSLSGGGIYKRNRHLIDPTPTINQLYLATFGERR
jgi:murein DD-endopeptidase MepM/ murein hydrolase activator NlpD